MKRILYITGSRSDYGKMKSILKRLDKEKNIELCIFICGMHLMSEYGDTYNNIVKDNFKKIYINKTQQYGKDMANNLAETIKSLNQYVKNRSVDLIIIHGDRIEALGGAIVGALNNILVCHFEGGEVSGTIDESMRHAISKLSHIHFVSNEMARKRLIQLGEKTNNIFIIGSPDIDVMMSNKLPQLNDVMEKYGIKYKEYAICIFHPVTTELKRLKNDVENLIKALIISQKNYLIIQPNNDSGSEIIIESIKNNINNHIMYFKSIQFEDFLTLLKNANFIIGNSSAGIYETGIFGVPSIDIGTRQNLRYDNSACDNIQHVPCEVERILEAISSINKYRLVNFYFGRGDSCDKFVDIVRKKDFWSTDIQKSFIDQEISND